MKSLTKSRSYREYAGIVIICLLFSISFVVKGYAADIYVVEVTNASDPITVEMMSAATGQRVEITFTDANSGIDGIRRTTAGIWGSDLIPLGTLFTIGGESDAATHSVVQDSAGEVIIRKQRTGVTSLYHIYPSGRIVLDAQGASSITVNQTGTFSEYSDGAAHAGGYHAYVDLVETAATASDDYQSPDAPTLFAGSQALNHQFDYNTDGFEEGRGDYAVIASANNAVVDFRGDVIPRHNPVLLMEEVYPKTPTGASMTMYWDAANTTVDDNEGWTGSITSYLTYSPGLRGDAAENDSALDYASIQTNGNITENRGTVSLWLKSSSADDPADGSEYIFKTDVDFNLYFDSFGYLSFKVNNGANLTYSADIYDGLWHEVTCIWDYQNDIYALYVDGKPRAASTALYSAPAFDATMFFTAWDATGAGRFKGMIDEVRIYNNVVKPTGHVLFHSRMDAAADVTQPTVGMPGGTVNGATFTSGARGNAATFDAPFEYITVPSAGNILSDTGTLEMRVRSGADDPSGTEGLFLGEANFNLFFDSDGYINFQVSSGVYLTDNVDTYDGLWHHIRAVWDYTDDLYALYVDGRLAAESRTDYDEPVFQVDMYLGAADGADTSGYTGQIDELLIYDDVILPYGAYHVPAAWNDTVAKRDPSVLVYWDMDSSVFNIGTGSPTLDAGVTTGTGVNGLCLINDASDEYMAIPSAGNLDINEGSLSFWVRSAGDDNPSDIEYLLYNDKDFSVYFNDSGHIIFEVEKDEELEYAADIYDAKWHFVCCRWDYANDIYELFVDGKTRASVTTAHIPPTLVTELYITSKNDSASNRFPGSMDELYITDSAKSAMTATVKGLPVLQPQVGMPLSYRMDISDNLAGIDSADHLEPFVDYVSSATNAASEYNVGYMGTITTSGSPSISGMSVTQNANSGYVTISFTGTDMHDDTVSYVLSDCEYSLDGTDGPWIDMATTETTESFTSSGNAVSFVWDAVSDTNDYNSAAYVRLAVNDGLYSSIPVISPPFTIDTLEPTGQGSLGVLTTPTSATLTWTAVTENSWTNQAHYEIWYGTNRSDVQNREGSAAEWDHSDDSSLATQAANTTTIIGLESEENYFFKIWAIDGFANESDLVDVSGSTGVTSQVRVYLISVEPVYDSTKDAILITTSLRKEGGTAVLDIDNMTLSIEVLDKEGALLSDVPAELTTTKDKANALFHTTWDPEGGLSANTVYTVYAEILYETETYSGSKSLSVNELGTLTQQISNATSTSNTIQSVSDDIEENVDDLDDKIEEHEEEEGWFRSDTTNTLAALSGEIGAILEDTSTTIPEYTADELYTELTKGVQAEIITRSTTVETGASVPIRFRSASGLTPSLTVYDPKDTAKVIGVQMKEVGTTGIYEYAVTFREVWGVGVFTVIVQENTKESIDSIMMDVVTSLATGGGDSAASSGGGTISMDLLYSRVTGMDRDISSLVNSVSDVTTAATDVGTDVDQLLGELDGVSAGGGMSEEDMARIINSINQVLGADDDGEDYGTIMGKLAGIESKLGNIGTDASMAASLTQNSRGQANLVRGIANRIKELMEDGELEEAEEEMMTLADKLVLLKEDMQNVPGSVTTDGVAVSIQRTIDELNRMAAEKGIEGLIPPIEFAEGSSAVNPEDVNEIRNGVNELKSLMEEVRGLLDQEINQPIIHGWLEGQE